MTRGSIITLGVGLFFLIIGMQMRTAEGTQPPSQVEFARKHASELDLVSATGFGNREWCWVNKAPCTNWGTGYGNLCQRLNGSTNDCASPGSTCDQVINGPWMADDCVDSGDSTTICEEDNDVPCVRRSTGKCKSSILTICYCGLTGPTYETGERIYCVSGYTPRPS